MTTVNAIPFWKMSGSGNDFVVIDNRNGVVPVGGASEFTRLVCRRRVSVGADGVVLIGPSAEPGVNFHWRYINADGSDGEMCGNGAMCGARFALLNGIAPATCVFRTESGLVHAVVDPKSTRVQIAVDNPVSPRLDLEINIEGRTVLLHAIHVGVPHVVTVVADVDSFAPGLALLAIGRVVRHHPAFAPAGTNFNLAAVINRTTLRMRTYERGVENETLACGTGAIASAIVATALDLVDPPINVITSSGGILTVAFACEDRVASDVTLSGDARVIVRGTIDPEALR